MVKSQETKMSLKCPICGGELKKGNLKEEKWIEGKLLVIDNLTARICNICGESIVDYATMQKIEQLIENFRLKKITGTEFIAYEIDATSASSA
jgi:YgiT-type zinc finger domain-containing protein